MNPTGKSYPELPRFGMSLVIPGEFENLDWFGRGPHENYQDRKASSIVGVYNSTVSEQYVPYIVPQENGYKTDTRWLLLSDQANRRILFRGSPLVSFSALHFSTEDLTREQRDGAHNIDLVPRKEVFLNIDLAQMGVGGDDSWRSRPLAKYSLPFKNHGYSYIIRILSPGDNLWDSYKSKF
jgi:beta-galactosidase